MLRVINEFIQYILCAYFGSSSVMRPDAAFNGLIDDLLCTWVLFGAWHRKISKELLIRWTMIKYIHAWIGGWMSGGVGEWIYRMVGFAVSAYQIPVVIRMWITLPDTHTHAGTLGTQLGILFGKILEPLGSKTVLEEVVTVAKTGGLIAQPHFLFPLSASWIWICYDQLASWPWFSWQLPCLLCLNGMFPSGTMRKKKILSLLCCICQYILL